MHRLLRFRAGSDAQKTDAQRARPQNVGRGTERKRQEETKKGKAEHQEKTERGTALENEGKTDSVRKRRPRERGDGTKRS